MIEFITLRMGRFFCSGLVLDWYTPGSSGSFYRSKVYFENNFQENKKGGGIDIIDKGRFKNLLLHII